MVTTHKLHAVTWKGIFWIGCVLSKYWTTSMFLLHAKRGPPSKRAKNVPTTQLICPRQFLRTQVSLLVPCPQEFCECLRCVLETFTNKNIKERQVCFGNLHDLLVFERRLVSTGTYNLIQWLIWLWFLFQKLPKVNYQKTSCFTCIPNVFWGGFQGSNLFRFGLQPPTGWNQHTNTPWNQQLAA